jgi:hypothetical protein
VAQNRFHDDSLTISLELGQSSISAIFVGLTRRSRATMRAPPPVFILLAIPLLYLAQPVIATQDIGTPRQVNGAQRDVPEFNRSIAESQSAQLHATGQIRLAEGMHIRQHIARRHESCGSDTTRPTVSVDTWSVSQYQGRTLATGYGHTCSMVYPTGQMLCWGDNSEGQTDVPTAALSSGSGYIFQAVAAGAEWPAGGISGAKHTCGLVITGQLLCWGFDYDGETTVYFLDGGTVPEGYTFQAVACGTHHTCGLVQVTGQLLCWGSNTYGQTTVPTGYTFQAVATGGSHTCGLVQITGELLCWGYNSQGQTNVPAGLVIGITFQAVAAGWQHTCGLVRITGELLCWGDNGRGRTTVPEGYTFQAVVCGIRHTCGLVQITGELLCWGDNTQGQTAVPMGYTFQAVAAGDSHTCGLVHPTGQLLCWGDNSQGQTDVPAGHVWMTGLPFLTSTFYQPSSTVTSIQTSWHPFTTESSSAPVLQIEYYEEATWAPTSAPTTPAPTTDTTPAPTTRAPTSMVTPAPTTPAPTAMATPAPTPTNTFQKTFNSLQDAAVTDLSPGTSYVIRGRLQVDSTTWTSWGPEAVWPTLPASISVQIDSVAQQSVTLSVSPIGVGSAAFVSVKCCTAVPPNQQLSFGSTQPEFNARCTSIVGSVSRQNALAGYPTLLTSSGATMTIATVDGSVASADCGELLLQRCMQHKFDCSVQNLAGWSPSAESQVVTTLPNLPAKAPKPQVKQIGEDGAMLADRFTLVLEAPSDTVTQGGA